MEKVDVGNLYKTTTNRGGGGPAVGEKPEVGNVVKMGKVMGTLGSSMALKSKKKLPAVENPDGKNSRP